MNQLSGLDAIFLHLEETVAPMHLGSIALYDPSTAPGGTCGFERYRENVSRRLHLSPCFRQKVARVPFEADHPYWEEDAGFDLDAHLHQLALPRPGNWQQLCIAAARFHEQPLDPSRPLWEMALIEGLEDIPGLGVGAFAVVTKVHHAAIDGVAGAQLIAALHDLAPDSEAVALPTRPNPTRAPGEIARLARAAANLTRRTSELPRWLADFVPAAVRSFAGLERNRGPLLAPRTRFNGPVSPHRVFEARSFDLQTVREIKKSLPGATVNDVVLAVCGGALRKYLEAGDELPEESLRAIAPISVRSQAEEGAGGNRFSYMTVSVHSDLEDPAQRLRAVHRDTTRAKARSAALGANSLAQPTEFLPGMVSRTTLSLLKRTGAMARLNRLCNTIVTNIPGPPLPLYSAGARLQAIYGLGPIIDGMGLIHPVFSYCGQITIAVSCCPKLMPDPGFYAECLDESFRELEHAVCGSPVLAPNRLRQASS